MTSADEQLTEVTKHKLALENTDKHTLLARIRLFFGEKLVLGKLFICLCSYIVITVLFLSNAIGCE